MNEKIRVIVSMGFNVVAIRADAQAPVEYYIFHQFDPKDNAVNKHIIYGKEISSLLISTSLPANASVLDSQIQQLKTTIQAIKDTKNEFSPEYLWRTYLSV